jgi:formylglycine-generating enzyme required for sulfatase activity
MRQFIAYVLLLTVLILSACSSYKSAININTVRIEDIEINKLLNGNSDIKNLRAEWSGSTIDLYYDILSGSGPIKPLSYSSVDDYAYSHSGLDALNTSASILSVDDNTEITWEELNELENPQNENLAFVIWADNADSKYKDMVYIPGGSLRMGSKFNADEKPKHNVTVKGFYLDKYEVTVAEFRQFCKATRKRMPRQPSWNNDKHPVVNVSWKAARAYAKWKGKRLPTEAEWEYAARIGNKRLYYSWGNIKPSRRRGGNIADESIRAEKRFWKIWKGYYDGFVYTSPVGSFNPNQFGLYDMTGNVCEWCSDWYDAEYYKNSPKANPKGPDKGSHKVVRGGSWNFGPRKVLTTKRFYFRVEVELDHVGFRCAKD